MTYHGIEENIRRWAGQQEAVRALVVIGSRARSDHAADDWSDLDMVVFVSDPADFARNEAWLDYIGPVILKNLQFTGSGYPEWIVLYDGGLKVDLLLATANGLLAEVLSKSPFDVVSRRGVRILVNKENGEPVQSNSVSAAGTPPETAVHQYHSYPAAALDKVRDWIEAALKVID